MTASDIVALVRAIYDVVSPGGALTWSDPFSGVTKCTNCGCVIDSGDCCLDDLRRALAPMTRPAGARP